MDSSNIYGWNSPPDYNGLKMDPMKFIAKCTGKNSVDICNNKISHYNSFPLKRRSKLFVTILYLAPLILDPLQDCPKVVFKTHLPVFDLLMPNISGRTF